MTELVAALAIATSVKRREVHELVAALFEEVKKCLLSGETIELRGFGTFEVKRRKGRARARNPRTEEIVSVEDHGGASFRPGRELKEPPGIA